MKRIASCLVVLALAMPASADDHAPDEPREWTLTGRAREAHQRGDFTEARRLLLEAYELSPLPALLFALGQEEFNLGNYDAALAYYERFIATEPSPEQIELAQQAIGATRMRRAQALRDAEAERQRPAPPPPTPRVLHHRRWKVEDSGVVALGGIAAILGGGLVVYSRSLAFDRSGTLADYDARLENARTTRWTGIGIASAGILVVGLAVLRWRLRPDGPAMTATLTPSGGGLAVVGAW